MINVALKPGMIVSNEPGYYKVNHYGIRIENLIVVTEPKDVGGDRKMMDVRNANAGAHRPHAGRTEDAHRRRAPVAERLPRRASAKRSKAKPMPRRNRGLLGHNAGDLAHPGARASSPPFFITSIQQERARSPRSRVRPMPPLSRLDHVVIAVKDLDTAAATYQAISA